MAGPALKPRRDPLQERSRETVAALLDAAAQVFESHGYAAGTTNRIAARAGASIGSLYQYFPNKEAILVALTERHLEDGRRRLGPLARDFVAEPPPLREGLERLVATMVELHADSPRLHRVLFEECPRPPELQKKLEAAELAAVAAVEAWLSSRARTRAADPRLAAEMVVQTIESVTHRLVIHPRPGRDRGEYATETVAMLSSYLRAVGFA